MTKVLSSVKNSMVEGVKENKLVKKFSNSKFFKRFMATFIAMSSYTSLAFADVNENGENIVINLINEGSKWTIYIGAMIVFFGVVQFAFAFKNHNAESQTNACMLFVTGAMLVSIRFIMRAIGVI